jgi:DNA-binding response OmpR family regulator
MGDPVIDFNRRRATWLVLVIDGPALELERLAPVDVHVRWLRSKVEREPDRPIHLVTVRGVGYRLDPPNR